MPGTMLDPGHHLEEPISSLGRRGGNSVSGETTPSAEWQDANGTTIDDQATKGPSSRVPTYPYWKNLPYDVESAEERERNLQEIQRRLYIAVKAGDFAPGAVHWTRELRSWMSLKFDLPVETRAKLAKFYFGLSLAPGIDPAVTERFASMFMLLARKRYYLRPIRDLTLDWRPLYKELKVFVLPQESSIMTTGMARRNVRTLTKLCAFAQMYFDPLELPALLKEVLPYFSASFAEGAFVVTGLLALLLPTAPAPGDARDLYPERHLPTLFHLWSLINRSKEVDIHLLDLVSRLARDSLPAAHITFSEHGIFTKDQSALIFTAILRLLEIPVGQATSPYSATVDLHSGLAVLLARDQRKHPVTHHIARWVVMSLSPACLDNADSILTRLEGLIQAIETFFHPSNSGAWTKHLSQLVYYLADFFIMRWNRERSGEMPIPEGRRLTQPLRERFVRCLRDVIFMGIYAKSGTAMSFSLSTLSRLAHMEPKLILPGALQRIYPSMQGLVEVHRTTSSLRSLHVLTRLLVRQKGYRCHVTTLLGLALPGVDANDLEKTLHTLSFIQSTCYNVPFHDLTNGHDDIAGSSLAVQWITSEVERMEREGSDVQLDYSEALSDEDEKAILRSSTAGFGEFLLSFLGKVFTLLENLPDASRVRSGSPEENVVNTLPATFTPLLACLSPELYDTALGKIADFVADHVIHQARDAMAFICNALCKVNPEKGLKRFIPMLIQAIRSEIDDNGAASTRNTGTDVLPRDRALVWNVSLLSMCVVHVGKAVLAYEEELFDIATYMQKKCKGIPTVHVSNFIHHLLLNLTVIYTVDYSPYEPDILKQGIGLDQWGSYTRPQDLTVKWHVPNEAEVAFAVRLFESQAQAALGQLRSLIGEAPPVKRDGSGREWSDEVSRNLVLLRLIVSGVSVLFDGDRKSSSTEDVLTANGSLTGDSMDVDPSPTKQRQSTETGLDDLEDKEDKPTFHHPTGYSLHPDQTSYQVVHGLRQEIGELLHQTHEFLIDKQEDDVSCFTTLYSAYRAWFIDVGMERSAHVLDRVTRLYVTDIHPYKVSGLRKEYPRPLLVRRALVHHLQRLRHNSSPRPRSPLDEKLLLDLAHSSVSLYTEIRRNAQSAAESAVKIVTGARPLVIPRLLEAFERAVKDNDFPRIKGAMYSLMFGSMAKAVGRDWRFTPSLVKSFIDVTTVDKPSIQKLAAGATFQVMEYGRPVERKVILDEQIVEAIAPPEAPTDVVAERSEFVQRKRNRTESRKAQLAVELVEMAKTAHWKKASRTATIVLALGMRFDTIAPESLVELLANGTIDPHPGLRGIYSGSLVALFSLVEMRAVCLHEYENYLLDKQAVPGKIQVPTKRDDPSWTQEFLAGFGTPETDYYVDLDYPGWLIWDEKMPAYEASIKKGLDFDGPEKRVHKLIGAIMTRQWFRTFFDYLKQEPRDSHSDRFRMASAMLLVYAFGLVLDGTTVAKIQDIKEDVKVIYGDGSDKHQHRATAEILGALVSAVVDEAVEKKRDIWDFAFPFIKDIFTDGLTPENLHYWTTFLHLVLQGRDPRRAWPLYEWISEFRLDLSSNAAFKESSKIDLLQQCISDCGWHYQLGKPVVADFLAHLDHPYKGVREAVGHTLASLYRVSYHESYKDVNALVEAQKAASSIGRRPYQPSEEFSNTIRDVFRRLEQWRHERTPGQQTPSSYTSGSKTVLLWLDSTLCSYECTQLVPFFPDVFMDEMLHMMDIKEDPELQSLAYHVFRHLPNVPHRPGEGHDFIAAIVRIGKTSALWHQRLRILINMQVIYFRQLFIISEAEQRALFDCVSDMLEDSQLEVRFGASTTLSGMIRCSPVAFRYQIVPALKERFTRMIRSSPLPKRASAGTPTPEHAKIVITRHAAVLGLGALVQAFPYTSPPPGWLPESLAFLAVKAAADPGMVGKSVKSILSDFKKTRQDTWHIDVKAFTPEQLEDLEGVLWKSYFA